ncbi:MAG: hypothetical protein RPS47_11680 [Colwellia sp.]
MNIKEPWYFTFEKLSKWILPYITDYPVISIPGSICGNCTQPSSEWPTPNMGVQGYKDSYGTVMDVCEACITLYESSVEAMGVERSKTVPNKIGMWPSVAVLAEPEKITLFMPDKIAQKLPESFPLNVVVATKADMRKALYQNEITYPAVYISDLGKKKKDLVKSMRYSYSDSNFIMCSADQTSYINLNQVRSSIEQFLLLDKKNQKLAVSAIKGLVNGGKTPDQVSDLVADFPDVAQLISKMGRDPYQRKFILGELK